MGNEHLFTINGWMICIFNKTMYKDRALTMNWARITVNKTIINKHNIIPYIIEGLKSVLGCPDEDIKIRKQGAEFYIPALRVVGVEQFHGNSKNMETYFHEKIFNDWKQYIVTDNNLQSLIINCLKKNEYRLQAAVYYTDKTSALLALDLLKKVDNEWSFRV